MLSISGHLNSWCCHSFPVGSLVPRSFPSWGLPWCKSPKLLGQIGRVIGKSTYLQQPGDGRSAYPRIYQAVWAWRLLHRVLPPESADFPAWNAYLLDPLREMFNHAHLAEQVDVDEEPLQQALERRVKEKFWHPAPYCDPKAYPLQCLPSDDGETDFPLLADPLEDVSAKVQIRLLLTLIHGHLGVYFGRVPAAKKHRLSLVKVIHRPVSILIRELANSTPPQGQDEPLMRNFFEKAKFLEFFWPSPEAKPEIFEDWLMRHAEEAWKSQDPVFWIHHPKTPLEVLETAKASSYFGQEGAKWNNTAEVLAALAREFSACLTDGSMRSQLGIDHESASAAMDAFDQATRQKRKPEYLMQCAQAYKAYLRWTNQMPGTFGANELQLERPQ